MTFRSADFNRLRKQIHRTLIANFDLAGEHVRSFDEFLREGIEEIVKTLPPATSHHGGCLFTMQFANPVVLTPRVEDQRVAPRVLLPEECKKRTIGYCGVLLVDVHVKQFRLEADPNNFKRRSIPIEEHPDKTVGKLRYWSELDLADQEREACSQLVSHIIHRRVRIVRLPIMLFSAACNLSYGLAFGKDARQELGGTFLVRGAPKIIPALARIAWNCIFVFPNTKSLAVAEIRCAPYARRLYSTTNVQLRLSIPNLKSPTFGVAINLTLQFITKPVPLAVVLRALGWYLADFKRAMHTFRHGDQIPELDFKLQAIFAVIPDSCSEQEARLRLASYGTRPRVPLSPERLESNARYILDRSLFPNVDTVAAKGLLLARAVVRLFATTCKPPLQEFDERDHLASKRFETVGVLWTTLLRQVLNNSMDALGKLAEKQLTKEKVHNTNDLVSLIDVNAVSKRVAYALSTGQWSASRACQPVSRKNVCQPLQTQSFLAVTSHFSRVSASVNNEAKQNSLRQVQPSARGFIDPQESPDGKSCGLVSHYSFGVRISSATDPALILKSLEPFLASVGFLSVSNWDRLNVDDLRNQKVSLCLEDSHLGWLDQAQDFLECFKTLRRLRHISPDVSVHLEHNEIKILCCAGRPLRPVLAIDEATVVAWQSLLSLGTGTEHSTLSLADLEMRGLIEYVDAAECKNLVIALSPKDIAQRTRGNPALEFKFTHMEIDASLMFGISSGLIPFPEHNQVTRNSFESAMAKQGIDAYQPSMPQATKHHLDYPQQMLVETDMAKVAAGLTGLRGQMCKMIVLAAGPNQEDSVIVSEAASQRGAMMTTRLKKERDQQNSQGYAVNAENFEKPDPENTVGMQNSPVDHLMFNGLARLGSVLNTGDIAIGKTTTLKNRKQDLSKQKRCASTIYQGNEAVVCRTVLASTLNGDPVANVFTKQVRVLERGDKLNSRHAQKTTVAQMMPAADMPVSLIDGTTPDLIRHPVSIFGRRTLGDLHECLCSKVISLRPSQARKLGLQDGTAFARDSRTEDKDVLGRLLEEAWPNELRGLLAEVPRLDRKNLPQHVRDLLTEEQIEAYEEDTDRSLTFPKCGREPHICGKTGQIIEGLVFTGLASFQKLLHFAADKIYAAFTAQKTLLLRYRGGRADLGGLRVGNMEVDVLAGYGVSFIMHESLVKFADPCKLFFCRHCGLLCTVLADCKSYCTACNLQDVALEVETVHLLKQFIYEFVHMNVIVRMELELF